MKHLFFIFIFILGTLFPSPTHAGGLGGVGTALELTQLLNLGELGIIDVSSVATSISTNGLFVNDVILGPIANALIASALQQASNDILSWVNGGFNGDPLIISNPEEYIKNAGLNQVRIGLGAIPTESIFGDSIFASVLSQYSGGTDLTSELENLSRSNIPSMLQTNICNNDRLTTLATEDIQNSGGTFSQADLTARMNDIYNYACVGDPNTDPQLAARLNDLNTQNSSIGGMDTFLAVTSGDNQYTKTTLAKEKFALAEAERKRLKENEIYLGAGTVSEERCVESERTPQNGRPPLCLRTETVTPGKVVQASLDKANTAGLERMINIQGAGAFTNLLANFATSFVLNSFNQSSNSSGGGSTNNAPVTIGSVRPVVQDLTNDPTRRLELIDPMLDQLNYYATTIGNLRSIDNLYLTDLTAYETRVQSIRNCPAASAVYTDRQGRINTTRTSLAAELSLILEAQQLIGETRTSLAASNSSQEIRTIFSSYMTAVDSRNLPSSQAEAVRRGEYRTNQSNVANDTELSNLQTSCAQTQQQVQQPVESSLGNN